MAQVNTNSDFGVDTDDDAYGTTTNLLQVPQEDLPPDAFDEEVKAPMGGYDTME